MSAVDDGPNGGREWRLTFSGTQVEGNVPLLTADTTGLTGSGVRVDVKETVAVNEPRGRFRLQADTAPRGWPEHQSGWIKIGASASEVEEAVLQISGIRAADVTVNASLPTVGSIVWDITFSHRERTSALGDVESFIATGQSGNREPLRVVNAQLSGSSSSGTQVEAETVRDGSRAISGLFEVYYFEDGDDGPATASATVGAGASASSARTALVEGLGLPEATEVVRLGPLGDNLAYAWIVTLPEGTSLWSDGHGDIGELTVNGSRLSGDGVFVNISVMAVGAAPLGGEFNVSLAGEEWARLPYNATDMDVADVMSSFSASGGNVSVSSHDFGGGASWNQSNPGTTWAVTFTELAAAGDIPMIDVQDAGLLTGTDVKIYANETSKGITADVQELTIDGYNGTFFLFTVQEDSVLGTNNSSNTTFNSTVTAFTTSSSPIPWDATASEVATAVLDATGKRVFVQRSSLSSTVNAGYSWLILFAEALNGTWGDIHLNTTDLVPDDDVVTVGDHRQANLTSFRNSTVDAIGGGFSVKFGQNCEDRAAGVHCSVAETSQLRIDSSVADVTAALEALPAIIDATVTDGTSDGSEWDGVAKTAPDSYGVSSAGKRFRVSLTAVTLNVSDSAVAEYWRRTWSPDDNAIEWSGDLAIGGDLPPLEVDVSGMVGSHATGRSEEVTKGLSEKAGGVVAVEVSQNAGRDYTSSGVTYVYEPLLSVDALVPDHGPIYGGTEVLCVQRDVFWQTTRH